MGSYNYSKDFFFPKEDGNLSFATIQQRIEQAIKCLQTSDDYILLDDGTKCYSKDELERAIISAKTTGAKKESFLAKMGKEKVVLLSASILLFVLSILYFFTNAGLMWFYILGCCFSSYLLIKKDVVKSWKIPFLLLLISAALGLLGKLFSGNAFIVTIFFHVISCILAVIGLFKLSKCTENKLFSAISTATALLFVFCGIFWVLVVFRWEELQYVMSAHNIMIKVVYILISIIMGWLSYNCEKFTSKETYCYAKPLTLAIVIAFVLSAGLVYYSYQDYLAEEEYESSRPHYMSIYAALNNGYIGYGMSYSEIENICGPADSLSRRNGVVEFAYYGSVQLCFVNGRFDHWND